MIGLAASRSPCWKGILDFEHFGLGYAVFEIAMALVLDQTCKQRLGEIGRNRMGRGCDLRVGRHGG